MEEKTRARLAVLAEQNANIDYASFGVKVLSSEEIKALYPSAIVDKSPWSESHKDFMGRRNADGRKKTKKKLVLPFEED